MRVEDLTSGQLVILELEAQGVARLARFIFPDKFEVFDENGMVLERITSLNTEKISINCVDRFIPTNRKFFEGEPVFSTQKGLAQITARAEANRQLKDRLHRAYRERTIAAVLAAKYALLFGVHAGRGIDDNINWDREWRNVLYVDLPKGGQISWHISPEDLEFIAGLPEYLKRWNGEFESREGSTVRKMPWRETPWTLKNAISKFVSAVKRVGR